MSVIFRAFGPLVVLAEVDEAEVNWGKQLTELQILRVETDGTLVLMNKDQMVKQNEERHAVQFVKATKQTIAPKYKKLPPIGYVNPFHYEKNSHLRNPQSDNSSMKWACMICNEVADNKEGLIEHYEEHKRKKDEGVIKAELAEDNSENAEDELGEKPKVQKRKLDSSKTICSECGKMVKTRSYERHMKSHQFKCNLCCESFSTHQLLEAHMDLHQNNTYPCEICGISFKDPLTFAFHNQKHSGLGIFKCPICPFETANRTSLKIHIKAHNNDFKCICEICGRGFMSFAAHGDHIKLHEGEKLFQCEYCQKNFNLKRYLNMHLKLNHKDILLGHEEWFMCHICARKFKFETSLARHLSCIHNVGESRRVTCPICAKVIANNYNLKVHMRVHNGERPYVCKVCQMGFARYKYLKKHMLAKHKT